MDPRRLKPKKHKIDHEIISTNEEELTEKQTSRKKKQTLKDWTIPRKKTRKLKRNEIEKINTLLDFSALRKMIAFKMLV